MATAIRPVAVAALFLAACGGGSDSSQLGAVPALPAQFAVDDATQSLLRAIAAETVQSWPPHAWCPRDPYA